MNINLQYKREQSFPRPFSGSGAAFERGGLAASLFLSCVTLADDSFAALGIPFSSGGKAVLPRTCHRHLLPVVCLFGWRFFCLQDLKHDELRLEGGDIVSVRHW